MFDLGGGGGVSFPFILSKIDLAQIKMEKQNPIPPKSRMKPCEGQEHSIFPSLIWGEGRGGV